MMRAGMFAGCNWPRAGSDTWRGMPGGYTAAWTSTETDYAGGVTNISDRAWNLACLNATNGQAFWLTGIASAHGQGNPLGLGDDTPAVAVSGSTSSSPAPAGARTPLLGLTPFRAGGQWPIFCALRHQRHAATGHYFWQLHHPALDGGGGCLGQRLCRRRLRRLLGVWQQHAGGAAN